jgi:hypothetical protein
VGVRGGYETHVRNGDRVAKPVTVRCPTV